MTPSCKRICMLNQELRFSESVQSLANFKSFKGMPDLRNKGPIVHRTEFVFDDWLPTRNFVNGKPRMNTWTLKDSDIGMWCCEECFAQLILLGRLKAGLL